MTYNDMYWDNEWIIEYRAIQWDTKNNAMKHKSDIVKIEGHNEKQNGIIKYKMSKQHELKSDTM